MSTSAEHAAFFKQWETYQKVIQNDYMSHQAVGQALGNWLRERGLSGHYLDLGCGDARLMSQVLPAVGFTQYTGVDLSGMALEMARENLAASGMEFVLHQSDLDTFLAQNRTDYDVVGAGYSLHHLQQAQKQQLFHEAAQHPILVIYDVFREEGESRSEYLHRYLAWMQSWKALSDAERELASAHIREFDFPEDEVTYREMAAAAGLGEPLELYRDPSGFHRLKVIARAQ